MLHTAVVAHLSQDVFGYVPSSMAVADMTEDDRERNASALASALLYTMIVPWIPCFFVCESTRDPPSE